VIVNDFLASADNTTPASYDATVFATKETSKIRRSIAAVWCCNSQ